MANILVICRHDWLRPHADGVAWYAHETFSRIAGRGNHIALVCEDWPLRYRRHGTRPRVEHADGLQIARLGHPLVHRAMLGLFLDRFLGGNRKIISGPGPVRFDVVADCVTGKPFPIGKYTDLPVLPIIFRLARTIRAENEPPGPVIAATERAVRDLENAGFPADFIVRAPFGADLPLHAANPSPTPAEERPHAFVAAPHTGWRLSHAVRQAARALGSFPPPIPIDVFRGQRGVPLFGYCAPGNEWQALEMGASGMAVLAPATETGTEFVEEDVTGLLYRPNSTRHLASQLRLLASDHSLRARLEAGVRKRAQTVTWESTATTILAAIEALAARA